MSAQQIRISQVPSDRVQFTRALRLISPMSLQQARELATHLDRFRHCVIVAGIEPAVAAHVADVLRTAGAEVVVEDSSIATPMLCSPAANARYKWGAFRSIEKVT